MTGDIFRFGELRGVIKLYGVGSRKVQTEECFEIDDFRRNPAFGGTVMQLKEIKGHYSVVRLNPDSAVPNWAFQGTFFFIGKTDEELSLVCESSVVPAIEAKREDNWRMIKVIGPLDFGLTGILSAIARPLAEAKISIFALSTFDTDYVLVKSDNFTRATEVLKNSGFTILPSKLS